MKFRLTILIALVVAGLSPAAAAQEQPTPPAQPQPQRRMPTPDAQLAAMAKLDYMAGNWQGEGWMDMGGRRMTFRGGEKIQKKLNGVALLVEGSFFTKPEGAPAEIPVHTTLGVMYYDPKTSTYRFSSWLASGGAGSTELTVTDGGWSWMTETGVKFTMTLTDGQWMETGEMAGKQFFEMRLKKVE